MNWQVVDDRNGDPLVSFDPGTKGWKKIHRILTTCSPRSNDYRRVVEKLGREFCRYYTRYRREAERAVGRLHGGDYTMGDSERAMAQTAAIQLVLRGVTPRALLRYWHENIRNFADGTMQIPPVSFLKSVANIDRVAVCQMGKATSAPRNKQGEQRSGKLRPIEGPVGGNSFSDRGLIDASLRRRLEAAGFKTQNYNDRYLLSVQHNARALARGDDLMLPDGAMRDMAVWAAENLYASDR